MAAIIIAAVALLLAVGLVALYMKRNPDEVEAPAPAIVDEIPDPAPEELRLYEEVANGWWTHVWGARHRDPDPEPPYDWAAAAQDRFEAVVGAGRGRAL